MPVTAEDVHIALGVNDADVTVTGSWSCSTDQTKFVLACRRVGIVVTKLSSLFHLLVVLVEAVVGVLNDEGVHHGYRCRCAKTLTSSSAGSLSHSTAW